MDERRLFELDAKLEKLDQRQYSEGPCATRAFQEALNIGWIYHDNALEGIVLSYSQIRDALARKTPAAGSRDVLSAGIREHMAAIQLVKKLGKPTALAQPRRGLITVALLNQLHALLSPADKEVGRLYRQERLPQRTYHHEIARVDKIPLRLHKLCELLEEEPGSVHPLPHAAGVHFEIMSIYPWTHNSGKVARLLMNLLLLRDGYPPALIPGVERQRYYASLRADNDCLADLVADTLDAYCTTATHFLDDFVGVGQQLRRQVLSADNPSRSSS